MKRPNWTRLSFAERKAVEDAGYDIWVEYPWHWVVTKFESQTKIHVWPSAGKVMAYFDNGASLYTNKDDLLQFIDRAFNPPKMNELTEDQIEFQKERTKLQDQFTSDWGNEEQI